MCTQGFSSSAHYTAKPIKRGLAVWAVKWRSSLSRPDSQEPTIMGSSAAHVSILSLLVQTGRGGRVELHFKTDSTASPY